MKTFVVVGLAAACLALSGVAFACGGGGCNGNQGGQGCQQSASLVWVSPTTTSVTPSTTLCSASASTSTLSVSVQQLVPGAECVVHATLKNTGEQSITLSASIVSHPAPGCPLFSYTDNLLGLVHPPSLLADHTFAYQATVLLSTAAGNACEGAGASWTVTIGQQAPCGQAPVRL